VVNVVLYTTVVLILRICYLINRHKNGKTVECIMIAFTYYARYFKSHGLSATKGTYVSLSLVLQVPRVIGCTF